ncbi:hypothetical protein ACJX0J_023223, partial [Zea mays]
DIHEDVCSMLSIKIWVFISILFTAIISYMGAQRDHGLLALVDNMNGVTVVIGPNNINPGGGSSSFFNFLDKGKALSNFCKDLHFLVRDIDGHINHRDPVDPFITKPLPKLSNPGSIYP